MSFMLPKRTVGAKIEDPKYAAEVLAAEDFDFCAYDITYDPEIAMYARKCARGDFSRDTSIAGKRTNTVTFKVDLAQHTSALENEPSYFKLLRACAMKMTPHGSTGISLVTDAGYTDVPITIEVIEKDEGATPSQIVIPLSGCMGNAKIVMSTTGQPIAIEFEFKGVLGTIADRAFGDILNPTGFNTSLPDAVLSSTISIDFGTGAEAQTVDTFTIDLGNDVQVFSDPAKAEGVSGAHVVDRNPTMELDPDLVLIATQGDYTRWTGNTTGALVVEVGSNMHISAPAVQIIKGYAPGDREGHVINNKSLELKRSAGNDELELLQGSKT